MFADLRAKIFDSKRRDGSLFFAFDMYTIEREDGESDFATLQPCTFPTL